MRKLKKTYESPVKAWQKDRILREKKLISEYGLKNKRELWKVEGKLRRFRRVARKLTASMNDEQKKEFLKKLNLLGLIEEKGDLDDVLELDIYSILNRRLQTIVNKKGFANTMKEARQLIVHEHIFINDKKITVPGYVVKKIEENQIKKI